MTTLADDIKALMCLGFGLERATELAVADRNRSMYVIHTYIHHTPVRPIYGAPQAHIE
jgi:hypothetical protein